MNHNWYAVITAEILLNKQLTSTEKLFVALVSNLSTQKGYCFASNKYLADCLDVSERQIQHCIQNLETLKIITRVMKVSADGELEYRALTIIGMQPISQGYEKDCIPPHEKDCMCGGEIDCTIITKVSNNKLLNKIDNRGVLPILEEVKQYCMERNNGVNPEKWFDFYSSKGWMIGKNKMRDWKAAVRTWEKSEVKPQQKKYVNADGTENSW